MIGQTPFLEFREQKDNYEQIIENNKKAVESATGTLEDPFQPTALTGKYLKKPKLRLTKLLTSQWFLSNLMTMVQRFLKN